MQRYKLKNELVRNFGGFFLCVDHFRKAGLAEIIDNTLGIRGPLAQYSYSDIFQSLVAIYLSGGSCIEDAAALSAQLSEKSQRCNFCRPDTILKMLFDTSIEVETFTSKDGNG